MYMMSNFYNFYDGNKFFCLCYRIILLCTQAGCPYLIRIEPFALCAPCSYARQIQFHASIIVLAELLQQKKTSIVQKSTIKVSFLSQYVSRLFQA